MVSARQRSDYPGDPGRFVGRTPDDSPIPDFQNHSRFVAGVIVQPRFMREAQRRRQILQTSFIPPSDILIRDIVAALRESLSHALDILFRIPDADVYEPHKEFALPCQFHGFKIAAASQSCLDAEAQSISEIVAGSPDCFPARS